MPSAPRGVATVSSGNHAQALALAARLHCTPAVILMPEDSPAGKLAATEGYGAEVIRFDRYTQDREQLLAELVAERGLMPVHPYDDERVMAGQGTVALELHRGRRPGRPAARADRRWRPDLGLRDRRQGAARGVRVVGVEPEAGDDVKRSLAAGERVRIPVPRTIADGQQPTPGERTFAVIREHVDDVVLASDAEIVDAMRLLFERQDRGRAVRRLRARRPARRPRRTPARLRVGVVISGGNVTAERFAALLAE